MSNNDKDPAQHLSAIVRLRPKSSSLKKILGSLSISPVKHTCERFSNSCFSCALIV